MNQTRVNPLTCSETATVPSKSKVTSASHALDSVTDCPVCNNPMQTTTSCGHPVRVCLNHRVCLPQEN